jgi:hypothetical protein
VTPSVVNSDGGPVAMKRRSVWSPERTVVWPPPTKARSWSERALSLYSR